MDDRYLFNIQKKIGYICAVICAILVLINLLIFITNKDNTYLLNLIILLPFSIIFFLTTLKKSRLFRLIHVVIFFLFGSLTFILDPAVYTGEVLFILGFLLGYQYKLFHKLWWFKISFLIIYILVLKLIGLKYSLFTMLFSAGYISVSIAGIIITILIFHEELNEYIATIKNNEIFVRLGLNYSGLVHALDYKRALKYISLVRRKIDKNEMDKAHEILDKLTDFIDQQDRMRTNILTATKMNKLTEKQPVDINEVVRSVVAVYETDLILSKKIVFCTELSENLLNINAIPFEIFTIFQNIVQNVIDMVKYAKKPVILTIRTKKEGKTISIVFSDTGPGFKNHQPGVTIDIEKVISHKVAKGFGLEYINKTVKANEGKVEIMNNMERGASVKLQFIT